MYKKLSGKAFVIFSVFIFISGIIFLSILYYILYFQYQIPNTYSKLGSPVTSLPKSLRIDLEQPDDDTLSLNQSIVVSGETGPNMDVLIMTGSQDLIVKSKLDGKFATFVNLNEGVNVITAVVFDSTGDNRSSKRTVYYSKEKI